METYCYQRTSSFSWVPFVKKFSFLGEPAKHNHLHVMNSLQYFEIDVQFLFDKRETIRINCGHTFQNSDVVSTL